MLPNQCQLRRATAEDLWPIRRLVLGAKLDPTQIRWPQFWVVEHQAKVIACGQLREFPGAQELGSLVVATAWRGQGIGKHLVAALIDQSNQSLYLECLGRRLYSFYQPFGFCPVAWNDLPSALRWKFGPSALAHRLGLPIFVMTRSSRP